SYNPPNSPPPQSLQPDFAARALPALSAYTTRVQMMNLRERARSLPQPKADKPPSRQEQWPRKAAAFVEPRTSCSLLECAGEGRPTLAHPGDAGRKGT